MTPSSPGIRSPAIPGWFRNSRRKRSRPQLAAKHRQTGVVGHRIVKRQADEVPKQDVDLQPANVFYVGEGVVVLEEENAGYLLSTYDGCPARTQYRPAAPLGTNEVRFRINVQELVHPREEILLYVAVEGIPLPALSFQFTLTQPILVNPLYVSYGPQRSIRR